MKATRTILIAAALLAVLAPALAQARSDVGFRGWGPRLGLSIDPDQLYFGAHLDFGHFARHVRFQPNVELGFGDDMTLLALNAEAAYRFSSTWDVWTPYLGGGLGANIKNFDNGEGRHDRWHDDSDTDLGLNVLGGIEKGLSGGDRFFIEAKFSLNDIPDAKIAVGWTFYH